jgi:hypothetical protein
MLGGNMATLRVILVVSLIGAFPLTSFAQLRGWWRRAGSPPPTTTRSRAETAGGEGKDDPTKSLHDILELLGATHDFDLGLSSELFAELQSDDPKITAKVDPRVKEVADQINRAKTRR